VGLLVDCHDYDIYCSNLLDLYILDTHMSTRSLMQVIVTWTITIIPLMPSFKNRRNTKSIFIRETHFTNL